MNIYRFLRLLIGGFLFIVFGGISIFIASAFGWSSLPFYKTTYYMNVTLRSLFLLSIIYVLIMEFFINPKAKDNGVIVLYSAFLCGVLGVLLASIKQVSPLVSIGMLMYLFLTIVMGIIMGVIVRNLYLRTECILVSAYLTLTYEVLRLLRILVGVILPITLGALFFTVADSPSMNIYKIDVSVFWMWFYEFFMMLGLQTLAYSLAMEFLVLSRKKSLGFVVAMSILVSFFCFPVTLAFIFPPMTLVPLCVSSFVGVVLWLFKKKSDFVCGEAVSY